MGINKTALVTGSSRGIGRAIAIALAKDGYDIAVHYSRSKEDALEAADIITDLGVKVCVLQGDTGDPEVPGRLVREAVEKLGRLDVMVNNAGITIFEEIRDITAEVMDRLYQVNFRGMILGASEAARYMVENGVKGSILFNTSVRAFAPHSSDAIYGGLKAALNRAIRSFAIDLGRYGIRVNGFSPGVTNVMCPEPEDEKENPFYKNTHRFIPLRRNGYAEDMADVVSWLVSDKASYVTGQVIRIDGGLSIVGAPEHMSDLYNAFDVADITDQIFDMKEFRKKTMQQMEKIRKRKKKL
ncbi:MAG: SDR family oxidoreductase [Clostridiales bacterium]|nr:SDR family oxidoreductase [Clostridiales bacterium]